jgi:hypothetical protein
MTLAETLLAVAIVLGGFAATYTLSARPGVVASATLELPALVDAARELAATSGDGATIVFLPNLGAPGGAGGSFDVATYAGRPHSGGSFNVANPARTSRLSGVLSSSLRAGSVAAGTVSSAFAVFIDTAGTLSYAPWTPSQGTIAQEPACVSPLYLAVGGTPQPAIRPASASGAAWFQLSCSDARLVAQP